MGFWNTFAFGAGGYVFANGRRHRRRLLARLPSSRKPISESWEIAALALLDDGSTTDPPRRRASADD